MNVLIDHKYFYKQIEGFNDYIFLLRYFLAQLLQYLK